MYALSIRQPWAELIARGKKKIEHRTWSRSHRGDLLIVASASRQDDECLRAEVAPDALVYGAAVCIVDLWKIGGDAGDYAWHLRRPRRVEPERLRGFASLYTVDDARIRIVGGTARHPPPPTASTEPPPRRSVRPILAAPRILLASKDVARSRSWQQALIGRGFNVHRVRDGLGAWNLLDAAPDVACVVLDGSLDGLTTTTLIDRMRASRAHARTPVVLVEGHGGPADARRRVHPLRRNAPADDIAGSVATAIGDHGARPVTAT